MMREYKFDVHNEMFVSIPEEREKVCLALSDSLEVINEELTPSYKAKLDNLLDQSSVWYPKALEKIIRYNVPQMVYISCKPTSLARDLEVLQARGYEVKKVCCVDMFPSTFHVETVVLLSKGEIDSKKVRVEFSLEDMDMSGFQKDATYEQIKAYVLEHTGLKVSSLYISQIKRKCGLDVGQNYNLSKKEDAKVPKCPPEKEAAIRDALKYFQMI